MDRTSDPIRALINGGPTPAIMVEPLVNNYDPRADADYVAPTPPTNTSLFGNFEFDVDSAPQETVNYSGSLIVHVADVGVIPKAGRTQVIVAGETYRVSAIRARVWLGSVNGFLLTLVG